MEWCPESPTLAGRGTRLWVAYVFQGGVGARVSNGFSAICLPSYLRQNGGWTTHIWRGYHFTIYMPQQLAQYSYLPTYLPTGCKTMWGSRRANLWWESAQDDICMATGFAYVSLAGKLL